MDLMDMDPSTTGALYEPLAASDAFRLMVLQPGQRHDPIMVQLRAVSATSVPEYDALSYVWGDPETTVRVLCNGLFTNITVNLHAALVQVRSPHTARVLWADALCINQKDKQERSQQVTIMGSIYSRARLVLVCMGCSSDGGAAARIASFLAEYGRVMKGTAPPTHDPRWQAFGPLLQKPWFTRAWVLQEVGLARNPRVVYDNVDFNYRDLMAAVKWLTFHDSGFAARMGIPGLLIHTLWTNWSGNFVQDPFLRHCALLDLLDHGALLQCRDPRDHIYAFLGHPLAVAAGKTGRPIIPNYEKDVNQVYKEATRFLLHQSGIRALSSAEHDEDTLADLSTPSWVVRWNVGYTTNNIHLHPTAPYKACDSRSLENMTLRGDILRVLGIQADTVKEVYLMDLRHHSFEIVFTHKATGRTGTLEDLLSYIEGPSTRRIYPGPQELALASTLCIGRIAVGDEPNFLEAWTVFRNWNRPDLPAKVARAPANALRVEKLWHMMMTGCQGRVMVVTEEGRLGLASHCSRQGDVCCVFDGGSVPFLLRPFHGHDKGVQTTGDYKLVGEAYVHGVMQGEAVGLLERGQAIERVFNIC
ncbi:HET-domain-containing protein [Coniochaeta hoffmannii]|uniref:HET-domain-containing protein n=1 Tax=Coniochaeta hoffmannii TaxID=91930 RepID=A0AA38W0I1_9PEZI|nr:HET-domain-containing protein [Coniochaeta hoffmannii]